ncbi:MAG TPA: polysaccharide deacetylase family protein [Gallionellaceae bacterium]|nr:polysaccharide deacetylase family protein [Gallionellaceae bacterium]
MPLLLVGGFALASLAYTLIMESDAGSNHGRQRWVASAYQNMNAGNAAPSAASSNPLNIWKPDNPHQVISAVKVASSNTYLFNSKKTREYFSSTGSNYDLSLDQWHYYFQARGAKYLDIHDADLTPTLKPGILILPSTVVLSSKERSAIQAFEKRGGSVLATWATGARDGDGEWAGYDFLQKQFDIKVSGEFAAQDKEKFLIVSGETPVASSLPSGFRIWLGLADVHDRPLRVSGGGHIAGRFMDGLRIPGKVDANEAIVYTESGSSRRVYLAFAENSWRFEQANMYTLLDDVLDWLRRRPDTYLANWPYPYRAAQILEMDTEQDFTKAINFADTLDANGFQGTFYSLTSVATRYPDIVRHLERNHEIAYHGDVHDAFKGLPRETQSKRLDAMQQDLRPLVTEPSRLRGFRPPYELADQVVESLLFEKGFGHILANADGTEAMLPYLSPVSPKDFRNGLIVLPRTQRDDMNFNAEKFSTQDMLKAMQDDFDLAHEYGALGALSLHSQHFELDTPVAKSTAEFLSYIKSSRNKTWIAPSGTIESWWRNRALFKSELSGSPAKMQLDITIEKPGMHWSTALVISNPAKGLQPRIRNKKIGKTLPLLVPLDDYQTAIVFNALEPGHYSYYLSY